MKSKILFFVIFIFLSVINKINCQTNTVYTTTTTITGGLNNVLIGNSTTGASISTSSPNPAFNNVFIGQGSGQNTFRTDPFALFSDSGSFNTFVGNNSGNLNTQGRQNCFLGFNSGNGNTSGAYNVILGHNSSNQTGNSNVILGFGAGNPTNSGGTNVFIGNNSGSSHVTGNSNVFVGTGTSMTNGNDNIVIGNAAGSTLATSTCNRNILMGNQVGSGLTGGYWNTIINSYGGVSGLTTGFGNTFLGPVVTNNNNLNYTFIYADPGSNQRFYIHSNGYTGIGLGNNVIPQNMLEVKSAFQSAYNALNGSGLRLTNLKNTISPITNPSLLSDKGVLSVDANGDVILVKDIGGGITSNCTSNFQVPVSNSSGNLSCSQISDNGTTVGIGSTGTVSYTSLSNFQLGTTLPPSSGNFKLNVDGVVRSLAYYAFSDKKFKKDIKPIENALETIEKIDGKTYLWDREKNKDKNFDDGGHSGFLAQELEKVLPHLVATSENGEKAVNYIELMPYLVEAIKEQQAQINDLRNQIAENFKVQNQDLINLINTKIISISPNPSKDIITISFNIEKSVQSAKLQVNDLNGNLISVLSIGDRENNISRTLQKDNFGKGIYIVSLIINGKSIDTKKIVFE